MKTVHLYTDGGCRGNNTEYDNNLGAIGGILLCPDEDTVQEYKRAYRNTTNNQMELSAVIEGLKLLKETHEVHVYSDSAYVVNAYLQNWIGNWKRNNWSRGKAGALKNSELWQELDILVNKHWVTFHKVKGHSDNIHNNRADTLVNQAMDEQLFDF